MNSGNRVTSFVAHSLLEPGVLSACTDEMLQCVARFLRDLGAAVTHEVAADPAELEELFAIGAVHPEPLIRSAVIEVAAACASEQRLARELLAWAVHDSDDDASVRAIQACRAARATEAATELFSLTGRTSARVAGSLAGCTDLRQILAVIALGELAGADADPRTEALRLQEEIFQRESVPIPEADTTHMVLIESEEFVVGLETVEGLPGWVPVDDVIPARRAKVPPFFIDRQPVTNREYDAFVAEIEEDGHVWCHHDEPRDTDHARSTRFDERLRPDDPATGVSWYDAYAFARWRGKKLPSDLQWELAARGPRGQLYPWGDSFLPEACNWLGLCLGLELPTRDRWVAAISSLDPASLARLTRPSRDFPLNVSYYGVADLIGNVWEWTRTRYLDRGELEPRFRGLDPIEYMGDWSAVACVKGGSWSSGGELLLPAYRGRRPVLERGPECGFRCVYEP